MAKAASDPILLSLENSSQRALLATKAPSMIGPLNSRISSLLGIAFALSHLQQFQSLPSATRRLLTL